MNEERIVKRCVDGSLQDVEAVLRERSCVYGTEALIKILASTTDEERESKIEAIALHHVETGFKPGPTEGVRGTANRNANTEEEHIGDPLIHHAALSQRVSRCVVDSIEMIIASAGENPKENARLPGDWGLYASDYLKTMPLECDPEPQCLTNIINAMGGWDEVQHDPQLLLGCISAQIAESVAHGHTEGIERALNAGWETRRIATQIRQVMERDCMSVAFLESMATHMPDTLIQIFENTQNPYEISLEYRTKTHITEKRPTPSGLGARTLRSTVKTVLTEVRHQLGRTAPTQRRASRKRMIRSSENLH